MRRILCVSAIVRLVLVLGITSTAMAIPTVRLDQGEYQQGNGGEFKLTVTGAGILNQPVGSFFPSFCMEKNEYVSFGATYYAIVNDSAVSGGVGGGSPDKLDPRTAWLYNEFLDHTLVGYDYSSVAARKESAGALQNAIWYLEEEIDSVSGLAASFVALSDASDWYANNSIGGIRILNLYTSYDPGSDKLSGPAQDQLVRAVPAPGAALLVGLGTTLVGYLRRRGSL